jgi:hypothetical protein
MGLYWIYQCSFRIGIEDKVRSVGWSRDSDVGEGGSSGIWMLVQDWWWLCYLFSCSLSLM